MPSALDIQHEIDWRRYANDEVAFLQECWRIRHPERGEIPFTLRPAQKQTLKIWSENRYTVSLKARQIGFSTLGSSDAIWEAFFHPDRYCVMLSKGEREAAKLLLKAKYGYKRLPVWMLERGPKLLDDNMTKMSWDNDSSIESLPSGSDPARGESVYKVYVDEWAFLPNPEDAWASIEPITDLGGRVIGISTANGSGNFFESLYVGAKTGANQFKSLFFPWQAATERDDAWYEGKKRSFAATPWILHQEYPRDDVECFIKSGMSVFDVDELAKLDTEKPSWRGTLVPVSVASKASRSVPNDDGPLQMWAKPIRDGRRYVIGADVAEGQEHGDYSVAVVIDTKTGKVAAKWRGHLPVDLFGHEVLWHLGWLYGCALIGVEANNMGIATCLALQNRGYPNLYYRTILDERSKKQTRKLGWYTTAPSKRLLVSDLEKALRLDYGIGSDGTEVGSPGELSPLDAETIAELRTFVREPDGKMHGSPHDDQVMALGIANQMRAFAFTTEWQAEDVNEWSIDGWSEWHKENYEGGVEFHVGAGTVRTR